MGTDIRRQIIPGFPAAYTPIANMFGVVNVNSEIERRCLLLAQYIVENGATVRAAAKKFGVSKSTVHKDLTERLKSLNRSLYIQAKAVLEQNKAERHIRGGEATRIKYKGKQI